MLASEMILTAPKNSLASYRKSYARIPEVISIPDLIKTQLEAFEEFQNDKLRELFDEISPIVSFNGNLELYFPGYDEELNREFGLDYRFDDPMYSEKACRRRGATYAAPLYVKVLLYNKKTDQPIVQEVYMGDFPMMTSTGTFIINGTERVVVSQLIRSPGAYFETEIDRRSGHLLCEAKLIPDRGAWLQFQTSRRDYLSVRVDRKRKMPVTVLIRALGAVSDGIDDVPLKEGSDEELRALFEDVDTDPDRSYLEATFDRDETTSAEEALKEAYKKLRPGDPVTLEKAKSYLEYLLFNPRRYDLGRVGRYKMNRRFENDIPLNRRTLTKRDLIGIVRHIFEVNNGVEPPDDIDHLGNRRIKTVGELIQNKLRVGFLRMERVVRERMSSRDPDQASPISLINVRPVTAVLREFFGGSQLSQFMGQTNPLDELTHKRTLSALGPGGLKRQHAGFEVRDVHLSHYGRICPIETPEGPNIGLIGRLATYADVNDYGFIETPYRRVLDVVPNDPEKLVGREIREPVVNPETGEVVADAGTVIDEALAEKMAEWDVEEYRVRPYVTDEVRFLSADEEERYVIAQANSSIDDLGQFTSDRVSVRFREKFLFEDIERVSYMDVSPKQIVGVSASLIPFLEHDDANRALMGSNMQRQAVPLLRAHAPTIGTGMEGYAAVDSGQLVTAEMEGEVVRVSGDEIVIDGNKDGHVETHTLRKFDRSNQSTCINHRPLVEKGDHVRPGDVIADNMSTENGELALGDNVLCAFMSWGGANFEDAVIVSEDLVRQDRFTSIHIEEHEIEARDTKLGMEEITRDIPNVGEDALAQLDEEGIVYVGAHVRSGDILVGKITPKGEKELTPEEKLLRAIFGEKAREVRDSSLRLPHGDEGKVIDVREFTRDDNRDMKAGVEKMVIVSVAQRRKLMVGDKMAGRHGNKGVISRIVPVQDMPYLQDGRPIEVILNPLGVPGRMNIGQVLETHLGWAAERLGFRASSPVSDGATEDEIAAELARAWLIDRAWHDLEGQTWDWLDEQDIDTETFVDDEEAMLFYLGNFLSDQDLSNERISDVLADKVESRRLWLRYWLQKRGYDADDLMVYENNGLSVGQREAKDALAREVCLRFWLQDAGEDVSDLSSEEMDAKALVVSRETNMPLPTTGKMILYDGRTGQPFDEPVTVGSIYMLKLDHLVEDKVHARSTGPYSLVTQQPLGGKAQFGGQRFGEMEVWALEAYGAAHTLQEMLTIKSDDVTGRVKTYESIVKGQPITEVDIPESFRVLVKELQGLGLSVEVYNKKGESYQFAREDRTEMLPRLGFGLGFGPSL
ncbi:MAG: DNA-directed RNA polymerase subunit beta [Chloroflexota bacterium]|nr:DNA-directed RNA polymerase subunit beta [Chloroflexota bacterium]